MRMVMAEEPVVETKTAAHVIEALADCNEFNNYKSVWATLDIVPTKYGQIVHMDIGNTNMLGARERALQTWSYMLMDNQVVINKATHA